MAAKRKRRASPHGKGLQPGEIMKRDRQAGSNFAAWGWVGSDVSDVSDISREHILATCNFTGQSGFFLCGNSYRSLPTVATTKRKSNTADASQDDDVIVISDDDGAPECNKKACRKNPHCLNYLGQEVWENEDEAKESFLSASKLGANPIFEAKDPNLPVGLKNLGATCYANAFIQVWFRDLAFRTGVYRCQPSQLQDDTFEKSPIFQLQVTFAALQESTQSVFNPNKLVESLQLRTTEQQDAQEFSKLFMSHLDAEFQKQSDQVLKTLITDQFQGQQVYGTICENPSCDYRSEHATDFLEIEINFDSDSSLEDCISALLQPEKLSGENQYNCPRCESLQDATRYTKFRQLPPVLHFSLLRFVYDFSSMERKKSKHAVSFPTSLDMGRFVSAASVDASSEGNTESNIFDLRGVLLHKGPSAYHGHYEAQVFEATNNAWFQFNDESVTEIKLSTDNGSEAIVDITDDDRRRRSGTHARQRRPARKKQRVDDSDDDSAQATPPAKGGSAPPHPSSRISSKDAYMLIYSRRKSPVGGDQSPALEVPTPPARALDIVNKLNADHDEACEKYQEREKTVLRQFEEVRQNVMQIYRSWDISSPKDDSVVVSRAALEYWLSVESIVTSLQTKQPDEPPTLSAACDGIENGLSRTSSTEVDTKSNPIDIARILCHHGRLDPLKAADMKRITKAACELITAKTNCVFRPTLTTDDICTSCVNMQFLERLYQLEHPRLVNQFDQVCDDDQDEGHPGYWISKKWLKDWRLVKPKMHTFSKADLSPDDGEFHCDVFCEHGELSLNTTCRRRISVKACEILTPLFPAWKPVRADAELCSVCETLIYASKEDKREIRRMAEEEKARLKHMNESSLNASTVLEDVPCAIVPTQFIRSWRHWLLRPTEHSRPDMIDNTLFICEHDKLVFDPNNPADLDPSISIIKRTEWDYLESLYSGGPLIALEKSITERNIFGEFLHDVPVCAECRLKRKSDWDITDITVRILGANDPLTDWGGVSRQVDNPMAAASKATGVRQSKRLRQVKQGGQRRKLAVTKQTTVKEIKVNINDMVGIPTICQRMFYRGQEIEDNEATMDSLGVLLNDVIDLREETEEALSMSDADVPQDKKRRREEERGFGGTLLGQQAPKTNASSNAKNTNGVSPFGSSPLSSPVGWDAKSCSACTFRNSVDAPICDMCNTPFPSQD